MPEFGARAEQPSAFPEQERLEQAPAEVEIPRIFDSPKKIGLIKDRTRDLMDKIIFDDARMVVFLDRSARPLAWLLRAAWDKYHPEKPMPKIKFANIGQEKRRLYGAGPLFGRGEPPPEGDKFTSADEWIEAVTEYWSRMDGDEYAKKANRDSAGLFAKKTVPGKGLSAGEILLVDDYSGSGFSQQLAEGFFRHHFPQAQVDFHPFLNEMDSLVFHKADWIGTHLPWNSDKSYTLLSDEGDRPEDVVAQVERDHDKRKKALALREEIRQIFDMAD